MGGSHESGVEIGSDREDAPRAAQDGKESRADRPGAASLERLRQNWCARFGSQRQGRSRHGARISPGTRRLHPCPRETARPRRFQADDRLRSCSRDAGRHEHHDPGDGEFWSATLRRRSTSLRSPTSIGTTCRASHRPRTSSPSSRSARSGSPGPRIRRTNSPISSATSSARRRTSSGPARARCARSMTERPPMRWKTLR